jgi:hypothetical protein
VGIGLAGAMLAGCGSGTPPRAQQTEVSPPAPVTPDIRACAGVEGVISHLTVDTVHWSPTLHPFDRAISARIALLSGELDKQAPQARAQSIKLAVHSTSKAFTAVSAAMRTHDRSNVNKAIGESRRAFRELKQVCSLDSTGGSSPQ